MYLATAPIMRPSHFLHLNEKLGKYYYSNVHLFALIQLLVIGFAATSSFSLVICYRPNFGNTASYKTLFVSAFFCVLYIQCVSFYSSTFVIYPEIKTAEVKFSALKCIALQLSLQDNKTKLGEYKETHCTISQQQQQLSINQIPTCNDLPNNQTTQLLLICGCYQKFSHPTAILRLFFPTARSQLATQIPSQVRARSPQVCTYRAAIRNLCCF